MPAWPPADVRHEMLDEAVTIIRGLFDGGYLNFAGRHFRVNSAKLWDLPDPPPGIGIAASGPASCELAGRHAAALIAVEPDADLVRRFDRAGGGGRPRIGQVPISWGPSREEAIDRAHATFRWFGGGWKVNAELPGTPAFEAATQFVTKDDVARSIPCGSDLDGHVQAVRQYLQAGFTDVAVVQIGGDTQSDFLQWAERELLPALRDL